MAATISPKQIFTDKMLYGLFKDLDHENINVLTPYNIQATFKRLGKEIPIQEI